MTDQAWKEQMEIRAYGRPQSDRDIVLERAINICTAIAEDPRTKTANPMDVIQRVLYNLQVLRSRARVEYLREVEIKLKEEGK